MKLSLYHYDSCWYCQKVRAAIGELGLDIELRDIRRDPGYRAELVEARGRQTVPVLRIEDESSVKWMPESADIIEYLYTLEGKEPPKRSVPFWVIPTSVLAFVMLLRWLQG